MAAAAQFNLPRLRIAVQNADQNQINTMQYQQEQAHINLEKIKLAPFPSEPINYNRWQQSFLGKCSSMLLTDLVDGTSVRPQPLRNNAGVAALTLFNARNTLIDEKDEMLWKMLTNTFDQGSSEGYQRIGGAVYGEGLLALTNLTAWTTLELDGTTGSLKSKFYKLRMDGSTFPEFVEEIRRHATLLAANHQIITDADKCNVLREGFHDHSTSQTISPQIAGNYQGKTFEELVRYIQELLKAHPLSRKRPAEEMNTALSFFCRGCGNMVNDHDLNNCPNLFVVTPVNSNARGRGYGGPGRGGGRGGRFNRGGGGRGFAGRGRTDISQITCYNCGNSGHYQSQCPDPPNHAYQPRPNNQQQGGRGRGRQFYRGRGYYNNNYQQPPAHGYMVTNLPPGVSAEPEFEYYPGCGFMVQSLCAAALHMHPPDRVGFITWTLDCACTDHLAKLTERLHFSTFGPSKHRITVADSRTNQSAGQGCLSYFLDVFNYNVVRNLLSEGRCIEDSWNCQYDEKHNKVLTYPHADIAPIYFTRVGRLWIGYTPIQPLVFEDANFSGAHKSSGEIMALPASYFSPTTNTFASPTVNPVAFDGSISYHPSVSDILSNDLSFGIYSASPTVSISTSLPRQNSSSSFAVFSICKDSLHLPLACAADSTVTSIPALLGKRKRNADSGALISSTCSDLRPQSLTNAMRAFLKLHLVYNHRSYRILYEALRADTFPDFPFSWRNINFKAPFHAVRLIFCLNLPLPLDKDSNFPVPLNQPRLSFLILKVLFVFILFVVIDTGV